MKGTIEDRSSARSYIDGKKSVNVTTNIVIFNVNYILLLLSCGTMKKVVATAHIVTKIIITAFTVKMVLQAIIFCCLIIRKISNFFFYQCNLP